MPSRVPWARGARQGMAGSREADESRTIESTDELEMGDDDPGYYQSPHRGRRHGSSFSDTRTYRPGDYVEGEEEYYDEAELSDEEYEAALDDYLARLEEEGQDTGTDPGRRSRAGYREDARNSDAFASFLQSRRQAKGREQAGLGSKAARQRAAQLGREARGEAGPDAIQRELTETIEKLRQSQTAMARSRRGRSGAAAQLGATQSQGALEAQGLGFQTDYGKRKQAQSGQMLEDFLLQREIAGEQAGTVDLSRQATADAANRARRQQFLMGLVSLAGTLGASLITSDERKKTNKRPVGNASREMLDKLETKKYDRGAKKDIYGGMAQSLKRSEMGKGVVTNSPDGTQMVDVERAVGMMLTTLKDQHKRIKQLEAKKGK